MSSLFQTFGLFFGTLIMAFVLSVCVLWLVLPLILYQVRNRLDTLIKETQKVRFAIKYLANKIEQADKKPPNT